MASSTVSNNTLMKELFRGVGPALRDTNEACKASQGWREQGAFATPRPEGQGWRMVPGTKKELIAVGEVLENS